jgi:hypothetical protein
LVGARIREWTERGGLPEGPVWPVFVVEHLELALGRRWRWFQIRVRSSNSRALRVQDVNAGTDARTHYYGMVSDGGFPTSQASRF